LADARAIRTFNVIDDYNREENLLHCTVITALNILVPHW